MQNPQNLIWIDLEMTGLGPDSDVILEIATIVTDASSTCWPRGRAWWCTRAMRCSTA